MITLIAVVTNCRHELDPEDTKARAANLTMHAFDVNDSQTDSQMLTRAIIRSIHTCKDHIQSTESSEAMVLHPIPLRSQRSSNECNASSLKIRQSHAIQRLMVAKATRLHSLSITHMISKSSAVCADDECLHAKDDATLTNRH